MSTPLVGPGDRYSVSLEVLAARSGDAFMRLVADSGEPQADGSMLVIAGDACSVTLTPGENGLTLKSVKLLRASRAVVTARVTARGGAPDWLPTESTYLLFQGDRGAAATVCNRYIPLEGMTTERPAADGGDVTPLDRLAVAVGRAVARANAVLARTQAEAGVGLVSQVTIRVPVRQTDLGQGRVLVSLAGPGEEAGFVELTLGTVPGAVAPAATAPAATAPGAPAGGTAPAPPR